MKKYLTMIIAALLIMTMSFSMVISVQAYLWPDRDLSIGMTGDDVLSLQAALTDQGYNPGDLDGVFGSVTESALITYQSMNGLYVDGVAGSQTLTALYGESSAPAVTTDNSGEINRSLYLGMSGSDVSYLQTLLQNMGYYTSVIDGAFGGYTQNAVIAYQNANGLWPDGVVGPITLQALLGGSTGSASGSSVQQNSDTGSADDTDFSRSLSRGMTGSDVTSLQRMLQALGYYNEILDGDFGGRTEAAVTAFQEARGLWVDGVAGPQTLGELLGVYAAKNAVDETASAGSSSQTQNQSGSTTSEPAGSTVTPSSAAPVLSNISNAPGGIEVNWEKVDGVSSYRVFRLDNAGTWQPIGDTSNLYYIDQNVVSGSRYTYTVRALASDGSYPGDYDRSGISFTYTYNYDAYVAAAPSTITKSMIEQEARKIGLDANEAKGLIAWVEGEGYAYIGEPYMAYLSACVVVNGLIDNAYSRGEGFLQQMATWGSYFSLENLKKRYENPSQSTLLAVYLALTNRQTGIYYCRGALTKPANCFYDAGFVVQGEDIYVW